jgi:hypothetical protein
MSIFCRKSFGANGLCGALVLSVACFASNTAEPERPLMSCKPAAERTRSDGCWIMASKPVGTLPTGAVYWTLDVYPSHESAEKANKGVGEVVEALDKTWLFSIGRPPALSSEGRRVRQIADGPQGTRRPA